jgi:hypothetical protein
VTVVVYVIISTATLATVVAAYPLEQRVLTAQAGDIWPVVLCLPIAVGLVVLANLVRRRRVTTGRLVAAVALSWIGLAAFGLDDGARAALPSSDSETSIPPSVAYVMVSALIFALGWRSLRRWLPRRVHSVNVNQPTLGVASGSWPWRVAIVPLSVGLLAATNITDPVGAAPTDIDALTREAESLCPDRAAIGALLMPLAAANSAVDLATSETIRSAVEGRIEMIASVTGGLDRFEPSGNWGADIKMRLIAAYERVALADQAFLDDRLDFSPLAGAYDELALVFVDFNEPFC